MRLPKNITSTRLDELIRFLVMGFDIKITPDNEVKVIEVKGIGSGMEGFRRARATYDLDGTSFSSRHPLISNLFFNVCEKGLQQHLGLYGENQLVYLATKLSAETNVPFTLGRKIISKAKKLNFQNIPSEWEERYLHLAYDLGFFEGMFIDKLAIDACFNDLREYKVPTYPYTRRNLRKLVDDQTPQYVVIKLNKLRACKGISVRTPERLQSVGHIHEGMGLIEAFVPSKEIRSDKNHKKYDGCMRYIVLVEETKERELNIHHFGGYWRLCFLPIKHYGMNMAMLAGLGNGAIPQMACRYELEQVRDTLNILVPRFYQNLVSKLNT